VISGRLSQEQVADLLRPGAGRIRNVAPPALRTYAGRVYHSRAEAKYAFELDALKAAGRIKEWVPQVAFPIVIQGVKICKVVIDFEVTPVSGKPWYIEVKGMESEAYKLKRKLLRACYPDMDYRVVRV